MTRDEVYAHISKLAAEHALIAQAFGGVITIVHPDTQRQHGIEDRCLYMAGQGPFPESIKPKVEPSKPGQADLFSESQL